jgi:undecaprenyl-diphosphatase
VTAAFDLKVFDESLLSSAHGSPEALVAFFAVLTLTGSGLGLLALVPFVVRRATRVSTLWLLAAIAGQAAVVSILKILVDRVRPCAALVWDTALGGPCPTSGSFPSGHAAGAFAFAAFVAWRSPRWAAPALAWATLVAYSRCVLGVHYPSDVIAGAFVGAAFGIGFAVQSKKRAVTTTAAATGA